MTDISESDSVYRYNYTSSSSNSRAPDLNDDSSVLLRPSIWLIERDVGGYLLFTGNPVC